MPPTELDDRTPGGNPMHGLLDDEVQAIIDLYHRWGEIDRSHRKLAHRGSYTNTVWVAHDEARLICEEALSARALLRSAEWAIKRTLDRMMEAEGTVAAITELPGVDPGALATVELAGVVLAGMVQSLMDLAVHLDRGGTDEG